MKYEMSDSVSGYFRGSRAVDLDGLIQSLAFNNIYAIARFLN